MSVNRFTYNFFHPDHLGSTSYVTGADGTVAQHVEYIPYGEVFVEERSGTVGTAYLFNAKELDNETGMYYYGARYLDPTGGMWISVDPMWEKFAGMSAYNYCAGNPVKMVDPDGKIPQVLVGAAIGFVTSAGPEIIGRLYEGQSIDDAIMNTFNDKETCAKIIASTVIGAATAGASAFAIGKTAAKCTSIAEKGLKATGINATAGAVDAGMNDVAGKIIEGKEQNIGETAKVMKKAFLISGSLSGLTQGAIGLKTKRSGIIDYSRHQVTDVRVKEPNYAGWVGFIGEDLAPSVEGFFSDCKDKCKQENQKSNPTE